MSRSDDGIIGTDDTGGVRGDPMMVDDDDDEFDDEVDNDTNLSSASESTSEPEST